MGRLQFKLARTVLLHGDTAEMCPQGITTFRVIKALTLILSVWFKSMFKLIDLTIYFKVERFTS